ncbi:DJ-1/PfpI family protein [Andreprevotia lacus]|nr:DJ-1/PfpI family protein [Andreprevotia lacus]
MMRITHSLALIQALLLGSVLIAGSASAVAKDHPKVLMVVASYKVAEVEYNEPRQQLEQAGAIVHVASVKMSPATTYSAQTILPDLLIDDARADDYDAIVLIGGEGAAGDLWGHAKLQQLVNAGYNQHKLVAAICAAPVVLARAGLLQQRKATAFYSSDILSELKKGQASYTGNRVEIDGRLITGNGPAASGEFGKAVRQALEAL